MLGVGYICIALTFVGLALISDSKIYEGISLSRQEETSEEPTPPAHRAVKREVNMSSVPLIDSRRGGVMK